MYNFVVFVGYCFLQLKFILEGYFFVDWLVFCFKEDECIGGGFQNIMCVSFDCYGFNDFRLLGNSGFGGCYWLVGDLNVGVFFYDNVYVYFNVLILLF